MTAHRKLGLGFVGLAACFAGVGAAEAELAFGINSLIVEERALNQFPNSDLTITNTLFDGAGNFNPDGEFRVEESNFGDGGPFANRHAAFLSADGGATPFVFPKDQGWEVLVDVTLNAPVLADFNRRKEAGLRGVTENNGTGLNPFVSTEFDNGGNPTDGGDTASFGAGLPFFSFRAAFGSEGAFTNGSTTTLGLRYIPGENVDGEIVTRATVEFIANGFESGPIPLVAEDDEDQDPARNMLPDGFTLSLHAQNAVFDTGNDSATAVFENLQVNLLGGDEPLVGDLNGDGFVGAGDLDILLGVWNQNVDPGVTADLNGDAFIGAGDLDILLGNWNAGTAPGGSAGVVPEPASLALVTVGGLALLRRRRVA